MSTRDTSRESNAAATAPAERAVSAGRRQLLRRAAISVPVIATIPSGAALARSSNLISGSTEAGALDAWDRTLCLDLEHVVAYEEGGAVDLGEPAYGEVNRITDRDYRVEAKGSAAQIREAEMCEQGGTFYYQEYGWQEANVPRGMLVSTTALSSFAGGIVVKDI